MSSPFGNRVRCVLQSPVLWILLFALLLRIAGANATRTQDDLWYITYAAKIAEGAPEKPLDDYKAYRLGFLLPLAGLFALFGVNAAAANVLVVATGTACAGVAYAIGRKLAGVFAGCAAGLLTAVTTQHVLSSGEIFVEAPVTLLHAAAVWCYLAARRPEGNVRLLFWCGIFIGLAYTITIGALAIAGVFAVLEVVHLIRRRDLRGLVIPAGIAAVVAVEALLSLSIYGEAYPRYREFAFLKNWASELAASPDEAYRSHANYFKSFVSPFGAFGILFPLGIAGLWVAFRHGPFRIVALWFGLLLAQAVYGSFAHGFHDGKYLASIAVPNALLGAALFTAIYERRRAVALGFLSAVAVVSVLFVHTRIPQSTFAIKERLDARWASDPRPLYCDQRTMRYIHSSLSRRKDRRNVTEFTHLSQVPPNSLVLVDRLELQAVRTISGHEPPAFTKQTTTGWKLIHRETYGPRGLPGFRWAADALLKLKCRLLKRPFEPEYAAELYELPPR